jgi:hypothetical protein
MKKADLTHGQFSEQLQADAILKIALFCLNSNKSSD